MNERQVTYLLSGKPHLPYLVASLWTLRRHWDGPVEVHAWPESIDLVRRICEDRRLDAEAFEREPKLRKRDGVGNNSQFLDKIDMTMDLRCEVSLYLDADTTVHGDLEPLFAMAGEWGFCATQWNDWFCSSGHARRRVEELRRFPHIPAALIDATVDPDRGYVSVNGGVWAALPESPVLSAWYDWTRACGKLFIADERVLHVLQTRFFGTNEMETLGGNGRWNSSPKYQSPLLPDERVAVYHYHGDCNVRPAKSEKGFRLWWPVFEECLSRNVGGVADWVDGVGNRWLDALRKKPIQGRTS